MSGVGLHVVMFVTNPVVYDPRVEKEADLLAAEGHDVTVLAWDRAGTAPGREQRGSYAIERFGPLAPFGGGLRSLMHFRQFWMRAAARAVELEPDVVHCHDLDTASAGLRVKRKTTRSARLVLDFHELYRESRMVPRRGIAGMLARAAVDRLERDAVAAASLVIVSVPGMVERYERMGTHTIVVENAPDTRRFRPRSGPRPERPFTFCYLGQKRYLESLKLLIDAVGVQPGTAALIAGGGTAAAEVAAYARGRERVEVLGAFSYVEAPALYERSDAVYAVYDARVGNIRVAWPVKVMEGMACGLPVIVNAGTMIGDYVTEQDCGLAVDGADATAVADAIARLAGDPASSAAMGARGRALVEAGLSWEVVSARLVEAYRHLG
ncbi:MAG: hypothetical protein C0418_05935 [Coriobacteriaceae bacterium]|nr:hypothetical protein [Coriobacteriaceae bacterium]